MLDAGYGSVPCHEGASRTGKRAGELALIGIRLLHRFEVAPRKWTKAASVRVQEGHMKRLKSSVTESGGPVAIQAAAAGPLLPTQPPPIKRQAHNTIYPGESD